MTVKELELTSYRNIPYAKIPLKEGINFFLGDNAQGKTNALEAIYLFARGKSFRGALDAQIVPFEGDFYSVRLTFSRADRDEELFYSFSKEERVRKRNGILLEKQSDMIGSFRAVLFSPEHLQMVKGSPHERRQFLNVAISQCYPVYLSLYSRYDKLLSHRNACLKDLQKGKEGADRSMLRVFSEQLASLASEIFLYRRDYVLHLYESASRFLTDISDGKERLTLTYESDITSLPNETQKEAEASYKMVFLSSLEREIAFGSSLFGVQRDDLGIRINGKSAREYGSQGQQRSVVLALKMAEGEISRILSGDEPVYLFDDVLSELDEDRRAYLLSGMRDKQLIVTGCEKGILGESTEDVHFIHVKDGAFSE